MEMRVIGNLPVSILTSSPIYGSSTLFLSREQYRRTGELSIPLCSMKVSSVTSAGQGGAAAGGAQSVPDRTAPEDIRYPPPGWTALYLSIFFRASFVDKRLERSEAIERFELSETIERFLPLPAA
jgi:hypothetical protein